MANVGYATLQVIPSLRGMDRQIKSQLNAQAGAAASAAGASAGRSFGGSFSSAVGGLIRGVGNTISSGLTAAGAAGGALFGAALTKGFGRVTAIQDATAALTVQLGSAAEAGKLLDGVLGVIKGTPFNLDQFATAAQRLAGMGIEASKIPHFLEAIGEASATQGRRSGEFVERLTRVFGQISAQGRIMGEDVLQLSETGVNALGILGNHFGVTTDAMRDMISRGAVPAQEALDVLAEGILNGSDGVAGATVALGGTMDSLRQTLSGSIGGFGSALARFGAAFITPLTPLLTQAFGAGSGLLDSLTAKVSDFAGTIEGRFPAFDRLFEWIADTGDNVGPLVDKLGGLASSLAPLLGIVGGLAASNLAGALGPLGLLVPSLGPLGGLMAALVATSPELREALLGIAQAAAPLVGDILAALKPLLAELAPIVTVLATAVGDLLLGALEAVTPLVPQLVELVQSLGDSLADLLPALSEAAVAILQALVPGVTALLPVVTAVAPVLAGMATALAGIVAAAPPGVVQAIVGAFLAFRGVRAGVSAFSSLSAAVTSTVTALANYARTAAVATAAALRTTAAWVAQKVALVASTVATHAMAVAQAALNVVLSLNPIVLVVAALAALVAGLVLAYQHVGWFRDFVDASFNAIKTVVGAVVGFIGDHWQLLLAILTGPIGLAVLAIATHWETIKNGVTAVKDWIVARFDDVVGFVTGLPGRIASAAAGMWHGITEGFRNAINRIIGWWNGLSLTIGGGTFDPLGVFGPSITVPSFTLSTPDIGLRLHQGGIFRSPNGDREGLALLENGEGVFTRRQLDALGGAVRGGGAQPHTMVMRGSGPLAEFIHKAIRTGELQFLDGNGQRVTVG